MYLHLLFKTLYFLLLFFSATAQQSNNAKYPGLLWEISGNGLTKPSYLFGTMHVSSKMAFHLSDSFYQALRNVDAVALELNPELWQSQMVRMNVLNQNYSSFVQQPGNDYLTENSFRIKKYDKELKNALSSEPPVVNSLLYRSYKTKDDFEEDTFLDLYIFQAGRKFGKTAAGVEDYFQSEKLVLEAYGDMAKEKKRRDVDLDESIGSLVEKMQNAYRRGDLDMMDSLDNLMEKSAAFREKFLYKRNEIQANAIDSIIRRSSLFAGVGAAHLPGERGVIELLRKKGYNLRPVKMNDRNTTQKEEINKLKVKVNFTTQFAEDHLYSVDVPGLLYALKNETQQLNRRQYADMSNGAYYMVTRVKTYASFTGQQQGDVLKKIDSLLYENIPGKIITKKSIVNNGYNGFDIVNQTSRGDKQRYQIFNTPFEIIIFKMSGKGDYVEGEEAARFFSSIKLKAEESTPLEFSPAQGGFSIRLPHKPHIYYNGLEDGRWEYEALNKNTGDAYMIMKRSVYNFNFLEQDTFDLKLVEESFRSPDYFEKQISRIQTSYYGYPALLIKEKLSNGMIVNAAYLLVGPHYFVFAIRTKNGADTGFSFFNSLKLLPYKYPVPIVYVDTFLRVKLQTPVVPQLDGAIRSIIEKNAEASANGNNQKGYVSYWIKAKNGLFKSDSTGEMVSIQIQQYPKYFYIKDSSKFWQSEMDDYLNKKDMFFHKRSSFSANGIKGYRFSLRDTGSSRIIERLVLLKDEFMYNIATITDTFHSRSSFISSMFNSFSPQIKAPGTNLYENKLALFFNDLFSNDSALHRKAQQSISNVYFGSASVKEVYNTINRLSVSDKDYFDTKAKLIAELGYIKNSVNDELPGYLKKIYDQTADTSMFQNEVIKALARLKTRPAYQLLRELVLHNPPVFENNNEYNSFFDYFQDSLSLSAGLFPEFLQLSSLSDYKELIIELLVTLVDSGLVKSSDYRNEFDGIYRDAKVALKKQQAKDEKQMKTNKKKEDDDDESPIKNFSEDNNSGLNDYAVLLMPFYDSNAAVQFFFSKLLQSKDDEVRLNTSVLLLRNQKKVPDSILLSLAANDIYRGLLYYKLEQVRRLDKFPVSFKKQLDLARSYMVAQNNFDKMDSIVFISKIPASLKGKKGLVYFFKYRIKKTDDWKIGLSGLQPLNEKELSSDDALAVMTDKKLKDTEPIDEQLNMQLKKILFSFHKSAKNFFTGDDSYISFKYLNDSDN